jgi:hypothetical protein
MPASSAVATLESVILACGVIGLIHSTAQYCRKSEADWNRGTLRDAASVIGFCELAAL